MCGNREAPTVFPAEFCWITPGQLYKKKLSRDQTTAALTYTTKSPAARLKAIEDGIGAGNVAALKAPVRLYISTAIHTAHNQLILIVADFRISEFTSYCGVRYDGVDSYP